MAEERAQTAEAQEQDLNEMMRVRREKMEAFRAMGVAPFGIGSRSRTTRRRSARNTTISTRTRRGVRCASRGV